MGKIRETIESVTSLVLVTVVAFGITAYLGYDNYFLSEGSFDGIVQKWFIGTETQPSILENAVDSFIESTTGSEESSSSESMSLYDYIAIVEKLLATLSPMIVPFVIYYTKKKSKEKNLDQNPEEGEEG